MAIAQSEEVGGIEKYEEQIVSCWIDRLQTSWHETSERKMNLLLEAITDRHDAFSFLKSAGQPGTDSQSDFIRRL